VALAAAFIQHAQMTHGINNASHAGTNRAFYSASKWMGSSARKLNQKKKTKVKKKRIKLKKRKKKNKKKKY
jgi:hypothetical protein